jgi:hypothetical protein
LNCLADAYLTESASILPYENSTYQSTSGTIKALLPKYSLIHVPILDKDETQSNFARIESGDGARGAEVGEKFEGRFVYISTPGGLHCVYV